MANDSNPESGALYPEPAGPLPCGDQMLKDVLDILGLTLQGVRAALPQLDSGVLAQALVYAHTYRTGGTLDYNPSVFQSFLDGLRDGVSVSRLTPDIYVWAART